MNPPVMEVPDIDPWYCEACLESRELESESEEEPSEVEVKPEVKGEEKDIEVQATKEQQEKDNGKLVVCFIFSLNKWCSLL